MRHIALCIRAVDNFMDVLVQYLLFHRYTRKMYILLCSKCDRFCVECCRKRLKKQVVINAKKSQLINKSILIDDNEDIRSREAKI